MSSSAMTDGCGPYPELDALKAQMKEAGFQDVLSWKLVLGESFFGLTGTNT